jgi:PAS domain-containing protein
VSAGLTFAIGEVAAMLALSPHTIRTWERRYTLPGPRRRASGHRRYTMEEIDLLRRVKNQRLSDMRSMRLIVASVSGEVERDGPSTSAPPPVRAAGGADEAIWRTAVDRLGCVALVLDERGRVIDCSAPFAAAVGEKREQVLGARFADFVDAYDRAKAARLFRNPATRRGWELNVVTSRTRAMYAFDSFPVRVAGRLLVLLLGRRLGA